MAVRRAVIAGAGYAGLSAYLALRPHVESGEMSLIVVNASDAHLLLPELPLFVAGATGAEDVRIALTDAVREPAKVRIARIATIDAPETALRCSDGAGRIDADGLIVALGSVSDNFGVPGVADHAIAIGRWEDAVELRKRLLRQFRQRSHGRIVVVGGGLTGVEVAADLASAHAARAAVTLVAPSLLSALPKAVQDVASAALRRLRVEVVAGVHATAVEADAVVVEGGRRLPADTVIWAAGVRGHPVIAASGLATNRRGQAVVDATLRAAPRLYCVGDCAAAADGTTGDPVPRTAQAAMAEGSLAARNLLAELSGEDRTPYNDHSLGFLVSLGSGDAAGVIAGHAVHGREVAVLKRIIERYHAFHTGGLRALGLRLRRAARPA